MLSGGTLASTFPSITPIDSFVCLSVENKDIKTHNFGGEEQTGLSGSLPPSSETQTETSSKAKQTTDDGEQQTVRKKTKKKEKTTKAASTAKKAKNEEVAV